MARARDELQSLPGIGPSMAADLRKLGVERVADLRGRDPQALYERLEALSGKQDRCVLYAFRCAVACAEGEQDPDLRLWWRWSDAALAERTRRG